MNFHELVNLCRDTHQRLTMAASRVTQHISETPSRICPGTFEPALPSFESYAGLPQNKMRFRQFYMVYPKGPAASHLLSRYHWVEILKNKAWPERIAINLEETRRDS